ncbi:MAG: LPS biosynthesis glycosyltransferase [Microcoleaceae cyanobacterium]
MNKLVNQISRVLIIAYKESTEKLEKFFAEAGFKCEVVRQEDKPEYQNFSRSYLCLMNHQRAWKKATQESLPTLIVEADFVPVVGFGQLPLPFPPSQNDVGISWLYTCASQVYSVSELGYAEGFSTSMVAYIINPKSAQYLIEFAEEIQTKQAGTVYSTWDSDIDSLLRAKKLKNYIPFRNYGEHGGLPNPEHYKNGLSKTHRADILYGKLAFLPLYTTEENLFFARLKARIKGIGRLVTGRFLRIAVIRGSSTPNKLITFAVKRQFLL